jgi:hypothetical protein
LRQHADSSIAGALVLPDPGDPRLTRKVAGLDHDGKPVKAGVVVERPLTLLLNSLEIVTMMTIRRLSRVPGGWLPAQSGHAAA